MLLPSTVPTDQLLLPEESAHHPLLHKIVDVEVDEQLAPRVCDLLAPSPLHHASRPRIRRLQTCDRPSQQAKHLGPGVRAARARGMTAQAGPGGPILGRDAWRSERLAADRALRGAAVFEPRATHAIAAESPKNTALRTRRKGKAICNRQGSFGA